MPKDVRRVRLRLLTAMGRGDLDAADAAAAELPDPPPGDVVESLGMLHVARNRFDEAATALARVERPSPHVAMLHRYARNMQALQRHRPTVFDLVLHAPGTRQYEIDESGELATIVRTGGELGGNVVAVAANADPAGHLQRLWARCQELAPPATAMAMLSVGDGHLLRRLAHDPLPTTVGNEQPVVIVEPDTDLLRACLMLHDLTPAIAAPRFVWCVGDMWVRVLREELARHPQLPLPMDLLRLSSSAADATALYARYQQLADEVRQQDDELRRSIDGYYANRSAEDFARALAGKAGRPPRALLLTSRFTTVLQYSTRDTAEALEQLGWETRVLIEEAAYRQITTRHVRQVLDEFRPDLVYMIDHLRRESGDLFPPSLPFVCWIQDDLPNLTNQAAGESVGPRDFVLSPAPDGYHRDYGYPLRQCLFLEKATRIPARPTTWSSGGDDLVYVSNASGEPTAIAEDMIRSSGKEPALSRVIQRACAKLQAVYAEGGCMTVPPEARRLVEQAAKEVGVAALPRDAVRRIATHLFNALNNPLYRQQALRWAAAAAEQLGLTLALYGSGWEKHPEFAGYARGPVQYGHDLEELTRRSKINLQIVPFGCLHQRLLDGIAAGGFFLIREHPIDDLMTDIHAFCGTRLPSHIDTLEGAMKVLDEPDRGALRDLIDRYTSKTILPGELMIPQYRRRMNDGIEYTLRGLPRRRETSFTDQPTLTAAIERYIASPDMRGQVWRDQVEYVERHQTYESQFRRILATIVRRLEEETGNGATTGAAA